MKDFDLKQWLFENKLGAYEKASNLKEFNSDDAFEDGDMNRGDMQEITQAAADARMQKQDDLRGDMVDNASMGVVAEAGSESMDAKIEEWPVNILGKNYLIDADVDVDFHYEAPEYEDHMRTYEGGYIVDNATAVITRLSVQEGDDIRDIKDPAAIKQIQDLINKDPKLNRGLEKEVGESIDWWKVGGPEEEDLYEPNMDETVGYAMITKPAVEEAYAGPIPDAESIQSYVKDIALSNFSMEDIPEASIRDLISNLQTKFEEGNIKTYEELEAEIERMVSDEEVKSSLTPGPDSKFGGEPTSDLFKMYTKSRPY